MYTKRTCTDCGIRKPQPEMQQLVSYTETGKSQATIGIATIIGFLFGHKSSGKAIERAVFNTGQRTYKRKSTKWFCRECVENH